MKDQPEDKFEQRIRARLQSLESDPPAGAWDRLAGDLPAASPVGYRRWAALLLLLAMMVGGAIWWLLADRPGGQEQVALNPIVDNSRADLPAASDARPSAESGRPYGQTKPSESENRSATPPKREASVSLDQNSAQSPKFTAGPSGNAVLQPELNPSQNRQEATPPPLSSGLATSALAARSQNSRREDSNERTSVPRLAPNQPLVVAHLPKVSSVRPSDFASQPLPSGQPTLTASRWELWASANPMLLYQRVAPDVSDEIQVTSLNRATFSQDRLGMQASAGGLYRLNPRLALKFGVYYRYTRDQWTYDYHSNVTDSFDIVRIDENTVEATPVYEEQQGTISETSHRVGALAGVEYRLSNRWFSNVLGAELQAQSLAGEPDWYAHLSYVAARKLSDRWVVYGGPSFLWNFSGPGIRSDHFVLKPYGFGAQLGISYRLQLRR
ncbi:MAG: hypothetical protein WA960_13415 [Tunicatimonas sp.]